MDIEPTSCALARDMLERHFAEYEGKKGGEYYTPETIVRIFVEVLQPAAGMRIYDPCHGSGGMFSQSMKFIETHSGNRGRQGGRGRRRTVRREDEAAHGRTEGAFRRVGAARKADKG